MILPVIWEVEHCGDLGALWHPSPSGRLHLGNLFCALLAWLSARQKGGKILLRVEDLDTARCPLKYGAQTERDLQWLGLDWDIGPGKENGTGPYYQSRRTALYQGGAGETGGQGTGVPLLLAPGRSCTQPRLPTGRTGRQFMSAPAGI